uniref:RNA-binding protein 41 n=1 Tax=Poecilia reticulata TaxID=8081 RepID=A0A3P9PEU6_POERE
LLRVSRRTCEEGPLLEEQETEGQRQLHSLLLQQLHTGVDVDRCVAKRQCFAPASLYRPFGEQAAGVRSLSQFQALQDGEKELVGLQELGLTDAEIQLWQNRDAPDMSGNKSNGVCAAPDARRQRLQAIRNKIEARAELLSRPQRFSASQPLSRREMEIEQALFQGTDRLGFLTALYHRDGDTEESQQGASSSDPMDSLYRDVLRCQKHISPEDSEGQQAVGSASAATSDQSQSCQSHSPLHGSDLQSKDTSEHLQDGAETNPPAPPERIDLNQQIGRLGGASGAKSGKLLTVSGEIKTLPDEEILNNRESDEGIRSMARFQNYQPGKPSKVLCVKNLSAQASIAQLVALFSRFEQKDGPPVVYRLLTGRMKGQAFIMLPDTQTAQNALRLVHGYRLLGKPLVVEFGRERQEEEKQMEQEGEKEMKIKEQRNTTEIHQTCK